MSGQTRRIRVLHSLSAIATGGVERRRLSLAKLLDPSRYEQRIMARGVMGSLPAELEAAGVPVDVLGGTRFVERRAVQRALQVAREFRPDIVHGAVFEGLAVALLAGRAVGARVVIEETSHPVNRSRAGHALFKSLALASDACVAISPAVGQFLCEVGGMPRSRVVVIPNGVATPVVPDAARLAELRARLRIPDGAVVLGTVGRLVDDSHKRVSDLLRAMAMLRHEEPRVHLVVVGDGKERPGLERLAAELGVTEHVSFAGHSDDVGGFYGLMDIFALVSGREGFGLVVAEAMLCGLPVIATAVGGLLDIVVPEETGLLIPPAAPEQIARAIRALRSDPERRQRLGLAGQQRARERFGAQRYVRDVDAFYQELLARPRGLPWSLWPARAPA
jgi:glycosyltransferase involved in cell wall biosynthesis